MTNIVLAMDSKSINHMNPLINSINKNVKDPRIYLICNEFVSVDWAYKIAVLEDEKINAKNPYTRITKHTYYRLFIDVLFPELDKCVYLDYDTLVLQDFSELLDGDDWIIKAFIGNNIWLNAGVLAFNINNECKNLLKQCRSKIGDLHDDQIIINDVFKDKITYISEEYNYMGKNIKDGIKIVHYIGNVKPWNIGSKFILWFKYL
jgi:lipopolysaccharide biosynthesis glycosyltransferase